MLFIFVGLIFLADALLLYSKTKQINNFRIALFLFFICLDGYYYSVGGELDRFYGKNMTYFYGCSEQGNYSSCSNATYPTQLMVDEYVTYKQTQGDVLQFLSSISWIFILVGLIVVGYDLSVNAGLIPK